MKQIKKCSSLFLLLTVVFGCIISDEFNSLNGILNDGNLSIFTNLSTYILIYLLRLLNWGVITLTLVNSFTDFIDSFGSVFIFFAF